MENRRKRRLSGIFNPPVFSEDISSSPNDASSPVPIEEDDISASGSDAEPEVEDKPKRRLANGFNLSEITEDNLSEEESSSVSIAEGSAVSAELPNNSEPVPLRRSTRRSVQVYPAAQCPVSNNPVKLFVNSSLNNVKKYYLDKSVKRQNPSLETIFEEPQLVNNKEVVMSHRRFKRAINFSAVAVKNSVKMKKRKTKAKKIWSKKPKKVPLKLLMEKLGEIADE
ncbi:hypothetical protein MTP99_016531 [Tenebrio molitor]|jgi:hypothetical protein|nr:hypothetical protein MTP99_016531 [Tenebrio molitor]